MSEIDIEKLRKQLSAKRWKCSGCGLTEDGHRLGNIQSIQECANCGQKHCWTRNPDWSAFGKSDARRLLDELTRQRDALDQIREITDPDTHTHRPPMEAIRGVLEDV